MAARNNIEIQLCQTKSGPIFVAVHSCYNHHFILTRAYLNNIYNCFDMNSILASYVWFTLNNCGHLG